MRIELEEVVKRDVVVKFLVAVVRFRSEARARVLGEIQVFKRTECLSNISTKLQSN